MASAISSAGTAPSNNVPSPPPEPDAKPGDETAASSDSTKSDPPKDVIALPSAGASLSPEAAANFDRALYRAGQAADNTDTPAADHENWTDASDAPPAGQLADKERAARLAEIDADPERYLSITKPVIPPGSGGFAPETEGEISDADAAAFRQGLIDRGVFDPETGELKIGARPLSHGPLDPLASNDGDVTAKAAAGPASVNDLFVNGPPKGSLDNATIKRLDGWLPDAIQNGGGNYVKDGQRSEDIVALAKSMGYEGSQVWERDGRDSEKRVTQYSATGAANFLRDVAEQDAVFDSAAELPSAFDIYDSAMTDRTADKLSGMDDKARRESFVRNLDGGTDLLDRQTDFEKSDFQKLDTWLPSALAGQGEMPNDAGSQTLLVKFAERLGWSNMPEKPGNTDRGSVQFATYERARQDARNMPVEDKADLALDYLKQERFLQKSLVVGSEAGDERASLIFEDGFVGKVVQHGVNQGVITDAVAIDAAMTAGALMNSAAQMNGASADGPVALNPGQFAQALAQRLSPEAVDPKRMMAGFNYVQRAGSLEQQQQRLTETILAFQTKDQAGIGAMTRTTWTEGLADYSGKLADIIGRRIEDPTSKRIANVLDHVGVPGYEKIKLSKGTKLHLANDETGRVADIQVEKKQNGFARFAMDAIMTGLSFTPAAPAAAGYFAMRGVEAAVKGDGIGAVTAGLGAVGGFASSFAAAANGAGAAAKIAQGARLASGAVGVQQGLKNGDLLGAVTSGLSAFSAGAQLNGASGLAQGTANLGRAANGLDAALNKDYLSAASAFSTAAGSQFGGHDGLASTAGNIDKIATLASGILNKDASQIVSAFGDQIAGFTQDWPSLNQPAPTNPIGPNTALDENGNPIILRAGHTSPDGTPTSNAIEIAPGDTLSQIAERHGTTVDELMAANPDIVDRHTIQAGQQLALPEGVQPVGLSQQDRLREMELVGGGRPILPSPARPELGDPMAQPGATHPNADPHTPIHAQPDATHPNGGEGAADLKRVAEKELSSIDEQIADIDNQLQDGVGHAPVAYYLKNERLKLEAQRRDLQTIVDDPEAAFNALNGSRDRSDLRPEILEKVDAGRDVLLDRLEQKRVEYLAAATPFEMTDLQNEIHDLNTTLEKLPEFGETYQTLTDQETRLAQGETIHVSKDLPVGFLELVERGNLEDWSKFGAESALKALLSNAGGTVGKGLSWSDTLFGSEPPQGEITVKLIEDGMYEVMVPEPYDGYATWASKMSYYDVHQDGRIILQREVYDGGNMAGHRRERNNINKPVNELDLRHLTNGGLDFSNEQIRVYPDVREIIDSLLSPSENFE